MQLKVARERSGVCAIDVGAGREWEPERRKRKLGGAAGTTRRVRATRVIYEMEPGQWG